jgi:hypothetical protein
MIKTEKIFNCGACSYKTSRKSSWNKHLHTQKHYYSTLGDKEKIVGYECPICNREYKYLSGLQNHAKKNKCNKKTEENSSIIISKSYKDLEGEVKDLKGVIKTFFDTQNKVMEQMAEQNKLINEMVPKIGNNNNNSFNINVFLNEKCKDALNMSDFIESLQIQVADLLYTKDNGLLEGISSVMINGLKQLDTYRRPIHCTDVKRETLYIKDNDEWEKENGKQKLKSALNNIAYKERRAIKEWENANPGWDQSAKGKQEYIHIVQAIMSDINKSTPKENKVIRNIAREINLNKEGSNILKN